MRLRRNLTSALIGAALLASGVALPTGAQADGPGWDDVYLVADFPTPAAAADTVRVAAAASGRVVTAWTDSSQPRDLWVSVRPSVDGGTAAFLLSDGGAYNPVVAVAANGSATVAWVHYDGSEWQLQARSLSASGMWGATQELSPRGERVSHPRLAVSPGGTVAVGWLAGPDFTESAVMRTRTATTGWSAPVTLSAPGYRAYYPPALAVDAKGTVTAVWPEVKEDAGRLRVARKPLGAALGAAVTLAQAPGSALGTPAATVAASGAVTVGWRRTESELPDLETQHTATYAGGRWSAPVQLGQSAEGAPFAELRLADGGDRTYALWGYLDKTANVYRIAVAERAAGRWGAPRFLSNTSGDATMTDLAALPSGHAVAVWEQRASAQRRVMVTTRPPGSGGTWGAAAPLSELQGSPPYPRIALAVEQTHVLWTTNEKIMTRYTYPFGPYSGSAAVTGKRRVGSTVTCEDSWAGALSVAYQWRRGTTVVGRSRTYVPTTRDFRKQLTCRSTATNSTDTAVVDSEPVRVARGLAPVPTKSPRLKGTPKVGKTLRVTAGRWSPDAAVHVTWKRGETTVGSTRKYHVSTADRGHKLTVVVRATAPAHAPGKVVLTTKVR